MRKQFKTAELIKKGKLSIGDGYRAKNAELSPIGLPFARAGNLNNGFYFEGADCFPVEDLAKVGEKISRPGDVVFTSKGTVGRFAYVNDETPRFVYSPQLCYWRSLDWNAIVPRYLYYWINSREFWVQAASVKGQTDMADYVSLTDQRRMTITLPSTQEQHAVADILGALDDKIELNRQMNLTFDQTAQALFKSWFVDFDPVMAKAAGKKPYGMSDEVAALFPDKFVDSELGPIPEGWRVGKNSHVLRILKRSTNPQENPDYQFFHYSIPAFDENKYPLIEKGSAIKSNKYVIDTECILISKLNPDIKRVWIPIRNDKYQSICSTEFIVCAPNSYFTQSYVYNHFLGDRFQVDFGSLVTGTSKSHQRVKPSDFANMKTILPKDNLAESFDKVASNLLEQAILNKKESITLAQLRDTLLPKLLSGQIRIRQAEKMVSEAV